MSGYPDTLKAGKKCSGKAGVGDSQAGGVRELACQTASLALRMFFCPRLRLTLLLHPGNPGEVPDFEVSGYPDTLHFAGICRNSERLGIFRIVPGAEGRTAASPHLGPRTPPPQKIVSNAC